ncbi:hypothetical protein EDB85DRAFT_1886692 [Lactarius pseudohatsudake]|nr:hypothetical protein EDB85DRAFT_1886692 [Lactarius pseudohatsudake]
MPKSTTLPLIGAIFRRKRDPAQANGLTSVSSNESTEAHTLPYFLEGPLITPGGTPGWATQPWHYVFNDGDVAWALGGNGRWRLVTVNRKQIAYNVTWASGGVTMRGTFAPGCGDIKPNTLAIRRTPLRRRVRCGGDQGGQDCRNSAPINGIDRETERYLDCEATRRRHVYVKRTDGHESEM